MLVVHDYLTQQGGGERLALLMARELSAGRLLTSFYDPAGTFPEAAELDVRTLPINRVRWLRDDPRRALPFLATAFGRVHLDEEAVICSSTGWSHGVQVSGHKVVYCNNPARWLYQPHDYLVGQPMPVRAALRAAGPALRRWDRRAAHGPRTTYIGNSRGVAARIADAYGITAQVLHPPLLLDAADPQEPVAGVEPGYLLTVGRPRGYKRTEAVIAAMAHLPEHRLVVVGSDPATAQASDALDGQVLHLGRVTDAELRWLYAHSVALVAVGDEDFGLTPLEQNAFGRPVVALRAGGYLDTVVDGTNGVLVDDREPGTVAAGVRRCLAEVEDEGDVVEHAARFSARAFCDRLREIALAGPS